MPRNTPTPPLAISTLRALWSSARPSAGARAASPGTRSITSATRWKRSMPFSAAMSNGVVVEENLVPGPGLALRLGMRCPRLGHPTNRLASGFCSTSGRDVPQGNDTHQPLAAVHYGQPPDAYLRHVVGHVIEIFVFETVHDTGAHDLTHWGVGVLSGRDGANRNVAIGDHADQQIAFSHWQGTGIDLGHDLGCGLDALPRFRKTHLARHRFAYSHKHLREFSGRAQTGTAIPPLSCDTWIAKRFPSSKGAGNGTCCDLLRIANDAKRGARTSNGEAERADFAQRRPP